MGRWGIIIFVAYVVWQIVYSITQSSQKKQQQQRARELTQQRRASAAGGGQPASSLSTQAGPGSAMRGTSRLDDLAERRRKQLEQLRQRRGQAGARSTQVRAGGAAPAAPPTARPSTPAGQPRGATIGTGREALQAWRESESDRLEIERQQKLQQAIEARRREAKQARRGAEAKPGRRRSARQAAAAAKKAVAARASDGPSLEELFRARPIAWHGRQDELRMRMQDRRTLRDLFIMKELIEPPLGLRDDPFGGVSQPAGSQ